MYWLRSNHFGNTNRIIHQSPIQAENFQPEMPEARFITALSGDKGLEFLGMHWRPIIDYCFLNIIGKSWFYNNDSLIFFEFLQLTWYWRPNSECHSEFLLWYVNGVCKQLTLHFTSCVSCFGQWARQINRAPLKKVQTLCLTTHSMSLVSYLSPWQRQNFPAPLKIEQTLYRR